MGIIPKVDILTKIGCLTMNIECTRFRVKEGKAEKVNEWLAFLNEHMEEVLVTLEGEKMYLETILREVSNGREYLYWYSIQGQGGDGGEESKHWIDLKHLAYWEECIDLTYEAVDLSTEVVMIPNRVLQSMN